MSNKNSTNDNLNSSLDWYTLKEELKKYATSLMAKETIESLSPYPTQKLAEASQKKISDFMFFLQAPNRPHMESLNLCIPWLKKLEKEITLKPQDLKDIRLFCEDIESLKESIDNSAPNSLKELRQKLMLTNDVLSSIDQTITLSGDIRNEASPKLYSLFNEKKHLVQEVDKNLDLLVKKYEMEPVLQERFVTNREGRRVIPVKSGKQHDIAGIVHDSSQSKQTVFMEPELVIPMNNRLRQIDVDIKDEIERIFKALTVFLAKFHSIFIQNKELLIDSDLFLAKSTFAQITNSSPCSFNNEQIKLINLKHPLLLLQEDGSKVIGNDLSLNNSNSSNSTSQKSVLILSGPNAGGKTILLKSIGLAAQMARCGLFICAELHSSLPFYKGITASVGDNQQVEQNLSTFAAHIKTMNTTLDKKGNEHLILIDEICSSTDPEEGGALAQSFIEQYAANNVFAIITSHLGSLKKGWPTESKISSGSLDYDQRTGRPTYLFIPGASASSQALLTAQSLGTPETIIKRSYDLLSKENQKAFDEQSDINELKDQLIQQIKSNKKIQESFRKKRHKLERLLTNLQDTKHEILEKIKKNALNKVEQIVAEQKVSNIFKKHEEHGLLKEELNKQFPKVIKSNTNKKQKLINSPESFAKAFPPGAKVYFTSMKQNGVVQSIPNQKGKVTIQFASMRLQIMWNELGPSQEVSSFSPSKSGAQKKTLHNFIQSSGQDLLDLRGFRIEEAIESLEVLLDKAMKEEIDRIKVIHGHGTETLKKAVRAHLSRSLYVQKWTSGADQTGGDGVTWVELAV